MGYVLPIKSIQSEQYANRMNLEPYNFAAFERVQRVRLNSDFLEDFKESQNRQEQQESDEQEQSHFSPSPRLLSGYIQPNPANLSPAISNIVGKGININAYV